METNGVVTQPYRVLVDTNYLLDYIDSARKEHQLAVDLMHRMQEREVYPFAAASSYKDVYYILNRILKDEAEARWLVFGLIDCVPIGAVDLKMEYLPRAISSDEPDFEDGLIRSVAEQEKATAIITRDKKAFEDSYIPSFSPAEFMALLTS
jgi:predicted nucleic acid-binding protein